VNEQLVIAKQRGIDRYLSGVGLVGRQSVTYAHDEIGCVMPYKSTKRRVVFRKHHHKHVFENYHNILSFKQINM
jgi:hypothetical protein